MTTGAVTGSFSGLGPVGIAAGAVGNVAVLAAEKAWDATTELMSSKSSEKSKQFEENLCKIKEVLDETLQFCMAMRYYPNGHKPLWRECSLSLEDAQYYIEHVLLLNFKRTGDPEGIKALLAGKDREQLLDWCMWINGSLGIYGRNVNSVNVLFQIY